jgi:hypothetical protein
MRANIILLIGLLVCAVGLTGCKGRGRPPRGSVVVVAAAEPEVVEKAAAKAVAKSRPVAKAAVVKGWQAAQDAMAAARAGKAPKGLVVPILGWGRSEFEAKEDAVNRATEFLADFLRHVKPPLERTPPPGYVRDKLIRGPAERREDQDQDIEKGAETVHMQCWSVTLAVTPQAYADLVRFDRQVRFERERAGRMLVAVKVLAGVLALLAAIVVTIRVDEWTKGFYTRRVRLAVACILAAVVLGLLIIA